MPVFSYCAPFPSRNCKQCWFHNESGGLLRMKYFIGSLRILGTKANLHPRFPRVPWSQIFWCFNLHKHRHLSCVLTFCLKNRVSRPVEKGPTIKPLTGQVMESFGSGLLRTLGTWPQSALLSRNCHPKQSDIVTSQQSPPQKTGTNWNGQEDKRWKQNMTFSELRSQLKRHNRTLWGLHRRPGGFMFGFLCPLRGFYFPCIIKKKKKVADPKVGPWSLAT